MYPGALGIIVLLSSAAFPQAPDVPAPASQSTSPATQGTPPASQNTAPSASPQESTPPLKLESLPDGPGSQTPQAGQPPAAPAAPGQPGQSGQQPTIAQQIRTLAMQQARWGAPISTPGVTLDIREISRAKAPDGTSIIYQLHTSGLTSDLPLTVLRWPLNGQLVTLVEGAAIDPSGLVICPATATASCGSTKPGQPIEVTVTAAKGEVERLAVVATDHKHGAAAETTPFPIAGDDKGCKMQIELGTRNAELVLIRGEGFQPSTPIALQTESLGEKHTLNGKTDDKGGFVLGTLPFVVGNDSGDTKVSYSSPTCSPSVTFHWGKNAYRAE